jgi:uncharacterized membrane protein YfhO
MANEQQMARTVPWYVSPIGLATVVFLVCAMLLYRDFLFGDLLYIYTQAGVGGDDFRVYFPVILYLNDWIRDPSLYSLAIGAGESIFAWANILFDPFNWPLFLLDKAWYPDWILYLQMVKHVGIFLLGYKWLKEIDFDSMSAIAGALCLASVPSILSPHYQFVSYYLLTLLYLWGVERCLRNRGAGLVVLAVLFIAITSIYMLYKIALFTALYLPLRAWFLKLSLKVTFLVAARLVVLASLTLLIAAPLILPTVELVLDTPRSDANFYNPGYVTNWVYYPELLFGLFGVGPAALLALPGLFLLNGRGKLIALICAACLVLFTSNVWFISLTTGFAKQTEFYMNFFYAVPVILGISYTFSRRRELVSEGGLWFCLVVAVGLYFYSEKGDTSLHVVILGTVLVMLTLALLHRSELIFRLLLLVVLLAFQGYWIDKNLSQQSRDWPMLRSAAIAEGTLYDHMNQSRSQNAVETSSGALGRSKKTFTFTGLNDSMLFAYRGTEIQNSMVNPNFIQFAAHYLQTEVTQIQVVNSMPDPMLDEFLGVDTIYSEGALLPAFGYHVAQELPGLKVYAVPRSTSLGVFTPYYLTDDLFSTLSPRQRRWQLHNAALTETDIPDMRKLGAGDVPAIPNLPFRTVEVKFTPIQDSPGRTVYQIMLPPESRNSALNLGLRFGTVQRRFLQVVGGDSDGNRLDGLAQVLSVARDGVKAPVWLQENRLDFGVKLQAYDYQELYAVVTGADTGSVTNAFLGIQEIDHSRGYGSPLEKQAEVELSIIGDGEIQGSIENTLPGMLVLQIPYRSGWQLTVDGEAGELHRVNKGLIGAWLPNPGQHRVELRYRPTYWTAGFMLSLLGLLLTGLYWRFSNLFIQRALIPESGGYTEAATGHDTGAR